VEEVAKVDHCISLTTPLCGDCAGLRKGNLSFEEFVGQTEGAGAERRPAAMEEDDTKEERKDWDIVDDRAIDSDMK
jgi:hypothetical protein